LRVAAALVCATAAAQGQGPAGVLLVVNRNSPESAAVAGYYAARRVIPPSNVCRIATAVEEEISREIYEKEIASPIAACLRSARLTERVLYIVTTLGVPLKIRGSGGPAGDAASVDSELATLYEERTGPSPTLRSRCTW
jgi:uncharacterized protein (TIGR03790 family)